ncbi:MAG: acyl carrier protein [Ignavibacteria bacterium]|nr:MAG: acyl carrier protein [Ignavibacteria bacterium]
MPIPDVEILNKLGAIMHVALRIPEAEVIPDARIFDDLGAESIDILDIRFRIEEAFGFKIDEGEIMRSIDPDKGFEELKDQFTIGATAAFIRQKLDQLEQGHA